MIIQGQVGQPSQNGQAIGTTPSIRLGNLSEQIVSELHGEMHETNYRGNLYTTFINGLTLAASHASPVTAGTGTPILGLHNPRGNGFLFSIYRIGFTSTSGTPGGPLLLNFIPNPSNITATPAGNYYNSKTLQAMGTSARLFNNTAITASTVGTPMRSIGGPSTSAIGSGVFTNIDNTQGSIQVMPDTMLALACTAAGTTHIISAWIEYEEVPI